jgi:hypothetical protein
VIRVDSATPTDVEPMPPSPRESDDTTVQGIVRAVGADPFGRLVLESGGTSIGLIGVLAEELGALSGVEVRVRGRPSDSRPPPPARTVDVATYEILSVAGRLPTVGTLVRDGDALKVNGIVLAGVPDELRGAVGARVWIVGTEGDGTLIVEAYGIIRRP